MTGSSGVAELPSAARALGPGCAHPHRACFTSPRAGPAVGGSASRAARFRTPTCASWSWPTRPSTGARCQMCTACWPSCAAARRSPRRRSHSSPPGPPPRSANSPPVRSPSWLPASPDGHPSSPPHPPVLRPLVLPRPAHPAVGVRPPTSWRNTGGRLEPTACVPAWLATRFCSVGWPVASYPLLALSGSAWWPRCGSGTPSSMRERAGWVWR